MKMKRFWGTILSIIVLLSIVGCAKTAEVQSESTDVTVEAPTKGQSIMIATTTSTRDSGLLDAILPHFQETTGIEPKVIAVGTGKALQMGVDGEADVLLVHAKASEEAFVANGDGVERFDVMYNDFVIVGPMGDPDGLAGNSVEVCLKAIMDNQYTFISRGDDSGTHKKELAFWKQYDLTPEGDWYISAGKGMGDVLQMASELEAYTMTDRATYLALKDNLSLDIIVEGDNQLFNQYGVIAVNPDKNEYINAEGAQAFIDWILSEEAQTLIEGYGIEQYGQPLFTPNAK
jgi:tungstate transport system substrate-binding protein